MRRSEGMETELRQRGTRNEQVDLDKSNKNMLAMDDTIKLCSRCLFPSLVCETQDPLDIARKKTEMYVDSRGLRTALKDSLSGEDHASLGQANAGQANRTFRPRI